MLKSYVNNVWLHVSSNLEQVPEQKFHRVDSMMGIYIFPVPEFLLLIAYVFPVPEFLMAAAPFPSLLNGRNNAEAPCPTYELAKKKNPCQCALEPWGLHNVPSCESSLSIACGNVMINLAFSC